MKEGWKIEKLDKIGKIVSGATPKSNAAEYWDGDILWLTPKDLGKLGGDIYITDSSRKITALGLQSCSSQLMPKGSIIMSSRAPIGHLGIAADVICTNQGCKSIVPNENMVSKFIYYYLLKSRKELNSLGTGAVFPEISGKIFGAFDIPVPPLSEQQQIVEKLDTAFDLIDRAKANIEKNIHNAKELFQSKLNQVFSQKGEGWEQRPLKEVLVKTYNINPKDFSEREFKYIDVSAVSRHTLQVEEFSLINAKNAPSRARKHILENDVIFATVRPTLKRVCLISKDFDNEICSTGYVVLRNDLDIILPQLIFYFVQTTPFMDAMVKLQKGASYPAVTDNEVKDQVINFCSSISEQQKIIVQLDNLCIHTELIQQKYQQKLANLEEMKKSILEKAFKGELI